MSARDELYLAHVLEGGARDWFIHGYFRVDLDAVWVMVERDLPPLGENVRRILGRR